MVPPRPICSANIRYRYRHQVLGQFVVGKMLSEVQVAATGGLAGVNHVAHLAGAASGVLLVGGLRALLGRMEGAEAKRGGAA